MKDEHLVSAYHESQEIWIIVKIVFCVADIFKQFLNLFLLAWFLCMKLGVSSLTSVRTNRIVSETPLSGTTVSY